MGRDEQVWAITMDVVLPRLVPIVHAPEVGWHAQHVGVRECANNVRPLAQLSVVSREWRNTLAMSMDYAALHVDYAAL